MPVGSRGAFESPVYSTPVVQYSKRFWAHIILSAVAKLSGDKAMLRYLLHLEPQREFHEAYLLQYH
jgi:hypothetical protein